MASRLFALLTATLKQDYIKNTNLNALIMNIIGIDQNFDNP